MRKRVAVLIRRITGIILLFLGVVGLALPFLQGILLIALGLYVLSIDSLWFRDKLKARIEYYERRGALMGRIASTLKKLFRL
jgi:uncharacterized membrane protein YbaN (DUF454 family)